MTTSPTSRLILAVSCIPILMGIAIVAFAWPNLNLAPRDLPLGVVGPTSATAAITTQLRSQDPGAFVTHTYATETDARTAIKHRDIEGAIVITPTGTTLLVASGDSAFVAQLLTQSLTAMSTQHDGSQALSVVDVVPSTAKDPHGLGLASSVLPLVIIGMLTGIIVTVLSRPGRLRLTLLTSVAIVSGLLADALIQGWLGALDGSWFANSGVLILMIFATASTVAGLGTLLGPAGLGLGALLMVFVGIPFSGISSGPTLLPKAIAIIGQALPPGAGINLLRSTAFFDGEGGTGSFVVLCVWSLLGLALVSIEMLRQGGLTRSTEAILNRSPTSANAG